MNPSPRRLPHFAPLSQGTRAAWAHAASLTSLRSSQGAPTQQP
ncbi:hypothetical protein ACSVHC_13245 [Arthrobacter sp. KNU-44]